MSRLKQDKLSDMLAAADATKQAAEQRSRRLEIKFARSDKGHALMQSAKLQASATEASKQVAQLQNDLQHKVCYGPAAKCLRSQLLFDRQVLKYLLKLSVHSCRSVRHATTDEPGISRDGLQPLKQFQCTCAGAAVGQQPGKGCRAAQVPHAPCSPDRHPRPGAPYKQQQLDPGAEHQQR